MVGLLRLSPVAKGDKILVEEAALNCAVALVFNKSEEKWGNLVIRDCLYFFATPCESAVISK